MTQIINLIKKYRIIVIATVVSTLIVLSLVFLFININKNKIYKNVETQIIELSQNIIKSYRIKPDYWGLSTNEVINKKLYPQSMKLRDNKLIGYFDKIVEVGSDDMGNIVMPTEKHFVITYKNLNKNQCIGVLSQKFNNDFWLSINKISVKNNKVSQDFIWGNNEFALPISTKNLRNVCVSDQNIIILHFYLMPQIKDTPLRFSWEGELQYVKSEYFSNKNLNNKAAVAGNEEI